MAELVDARDSKSRDCEVMGVRFPLPAPKTLLKLFKILFKHSIHATVTPEKMLYFYLVL